MVSQRAAADKLLAVQRLDLGPHLHARLHAAKGGPHFMTQGASHCIDCKLAPGGSIKFFRFCSGDEKRSRAQPMTAQKQGNQATFQIEAKAQLHVPPTEIGGGDHTIHISAEPARQCQIE